MSRAITPPDTDFDANTHSIMVINASETDVEVLGLVLKQLPVDVDMYLYRDEFGNPDWVTTVAASVDKVFKCPTNHVQDIVNYLQAING